MTNCADKGFIFVTERCGQNYISFAVPRPSPCSGGGSCSWKCECSGKRGCNVYQLNINNIHADNSVHGDNSSSGEIEIEGMMCNVPTGTGCLDADCDLLPPGPPPESVPIDLRKINPKNFNLAGKGLNIQIDGKGNVAINGEVLDKDKLVKED